MSAHRRLVVSSASFAKARQCRLRLTFSCRKCLSSFNSLYVLLLNTGVEKGFMIFLMATEVPDNWSFAELKEV